MCVTYYICTRPIGLPNTAILHATFTSRIWRLLWRLLKISVIYKRSLKVSASLFGRDDEKIRQPKSSNSKFTHFLEEVEEANHVELVKLESLPAPQRCSYNSWRRWFLVLFWGDDDSAYSVAGPGICMDPCLNAANTCRKTLSTFIVRTIAERKQNFMMPEAGRNSACIWSRNFDRQKELRVILSGILSITGDWCSDAIMGYW